MHDMQSTYLHSLVRGAKHCQTESISFQVSRESVQSTELYHVCRSPKFEPFLPEPLDDPFPVPFVFAEPHVSQLSHGIRLLDSKWADQWDAQDLNRRFSGSTTQCSQEQQIVQNQSKTIYLD